MSLLLIIGLFVVRFTTTEIKIADSQAVSTKNYHLAEAGINEMIWKIQNDPTTNFNFINGTLGESDNINRTQIFGDGRAHYYVSVRSIDDANAEIIATSTYAIGNAESQRVVKASIFKATGSPVEWPHGFFAGGIPDPSNPNYGDILYSGNNRSMTINGGRIHANDELYIDGNNTTVTLNGGAMTAHTDIDIDGNNSSFNTINGGYQEYPTSTVEMPQIDFNSDAASSWKNRATATYTYAQLKTLLGNNSNVTLNGIIFITNTSGTPINGNNSRLTINGTLIVDRSFVFSGNNSYLTINEHETYGSGLLVNGDTELIGNNNIYNIDGVIYTSRKLYVGGNNTNYTINGGIVCSWAELEHNNANFTLNYNASSTYTSLEPSLNTTSPIIQINHWEEKY
jgi:hypothetical protein